MLKLLAIDMDGTCLNGRSRISPKVLKALEAAHNAGVLIVPTTGRALTCLPHQLAERRDLYRYVISSNGARVTNLADKRTIFRAEIPQETALRLLDDLRGASLGCTAHVEHQYLIQGRILHAMGRTVYGRDAKQAPMVASIAEAIRSGSANVEELQFFFLGKGSREATEKVLQGYPELDAAYSGLYVEIFHQSASKGTALGALMDQLGLLPEAVGCIGDGENDLSMFARAGHRYAMGNAVEALKAQADAVLPSNRKDGVAEAIFRYILEA